MDPGAVQVLVQRPERAAEARVVSVAAGAEVELRLADGPAAVAPAPGPTSPRLRPWITASAITGTVGLAGFGTFYLLADAQHRRLEERCGPAGCDGAPEDDIDRGRLYQTLANVSLVVGVTGALAAVTLWALDRPRGERSPVAVVVSPTSLGLLGRF